MNAEHRCPQCDAELAANAPQGLCPACLLKGGLGTETGGTGTGNPSPGDEFVPPTPAELAPHFPDLEILELVGRGGMGVVYKARQKQLDRLVALKILAPKIGQDPAFAERFAREARAMAMLSHPHVVAVYDFGQTDGLYYFLMEFVDGLNLRRLLDTGKLAPEEALAIVPQICDALQYAHDHGVVHRDIKPENVLLEQGGPGQDRRLRHCQAGWPRGERTLTLDRRRPDDGHAPLHGPGADRASATRSIIGPTSTRLGVVFYQMLTGELPHRPLRPAVEKSADRRAAG